MDDDTIRFLIYAVTVCFMGALAVALVYLLPH